MTGSKKWRLVSSQGSKRPSFRIGLLGTFYCGLFGNSVTISTQAL